MKRFLIAIFVLVEIVSCDRHSEHWDRISRVESYIETHPDSALAVLQPIDPEELTNKKEKAKHALLLSMALDKNYIDKTDFETLQPAIDYYRRRGTATDKLRTLFYQGRIYQNQGNSASAMTSYLAGLDEGEESDDVLTKARLLVAQGNIYHSLMKWDDVCSANLKAAEYFEQAGRIDSHINCLLKAIGGFINKKDFDNVEKYLSDCHHYVNTMSLNRLQSYYSCRLTYQTSTHSHDQLEKTIGEYLSAIPTDLHDRTTLANAYLEIGQHEKALEMISDEKEPDNINYRLKYYAVLTKIYKELNNSGKALEAFQSYYNLYDSNVFSVFEQDTQFIEERYALNLQTLKERESKKLLIICGILIFTILIAIILYAQTLLKIKMIETDRYKLLYQQVEHERDNLSELLSQTNDLNNEARIIVAKRLELLNKFFTAYITNNAEIERNLDRELQELLDNKERFMASTKLAFAGSHPKFIKYLEGRGLTDWEIQYCCLYALGLKGKEVGSYIKRRSHYNFSSEVREKLGLGESDTNLGIHIRKLVKSLEQ